MINFDLKLSWANMKRIVLIGIVCALHSFVSACGFEPLYSPKGNVSAPALHMISIDKIKDRSGQKLRNFLLDRMAANAGDKKADYKLKITLQESTSAINIRKDDSATRMNLLIRAEFTLIKMTGDHKVFKGHVLSTNSYNILDSDFATLSSEDNTRHRALLYLAEEIRLRVAIALQNPAMFRPHSAAPSPKP